MAVSWIDKLILIVQPEDSSRLQNVDAFYVAVFRPVDKKPTLSVKALVWTVIAILAGLGIGQLSVIFKCRIDGRYLRARSGSLFQI